MLNPIIIHYKDNISFSAPSKNTYSVNLEANDDDIGSKISNALIEIDRLYKYDVIVIKDSLSQNYLDFFGLLFAHHIRFSSSFKGKNFPIIIVSDLNVYQIGKLTSLSNILFTDGIYLAKNNSDSIQKFITKDLSPLIKFYEFLEKITISPPANYENSHSIANEWSIYQWSCHLHVDMRFIEGVVENIENMLYFKYLKAKYPINVKPADEFKKLDVESKILYIDDEWNKGWKIIFEKIFKSTAKPNGFTYLNETFKNKTQDHIIDLAEAMFNDKNPDIVLLDLRLHDSDFNQTIIENLTGIKLLKKIKNINPGIQVIIFSASQKNLILEEVMDEGALGYVNKEHPDAYDSASSDSINKLQKLLERADQRKFLKDIWKIYQSIYSKLDNDPFTQYKDINPDYKKLIDILKIEVKYVYDILDSNIENKFNYSMLSIARSLEAFKKIYINDQNENDQYFWNHKEQNVSSNLKEIIISIIEKKMNHHDLSSTSSSLGIFIRRRNFYLHSKPIDPVTSTEIVQWFAILNDIIDLSQKPL